jgi:hypothetical protein
MAERRAVRRAQNEYESAQDNGQRGDGGEDREDPEARSRTSGRPGRDAGLTAPEAAQRGLHQIAELTGKEPEGITGVEPADNGWIVGVEVVEDRRIPSSTDILATYETEFDVSGELLSYRRLRRYPRGRGDSSEDT